MKSLPNTCSAAAWLCGRQTSLRLSTVDFPPSATGTMWSYSRFFVELQRHPFGMSAVHVPPSRSWTALRVLTEMQRVVAALRP
jgi:hypothetical protein